MSNNEPHSFEDETIHEKPVINEKAITHQETLSNTEKAEIEAEKKIIDLDKTVLFAHGTFLPNLHYFPEHGIGLEKLGNKVVVGFNGPKTADHRGYIANYKTNFFMGVSYGKTKEEEYQKYSKLEPNVKYPVFILLDPDIIMTKCNIGMDHDCWQLLDALSEDDFKKACMGIVINSEEINILPNAYNDYGQESLQRILDNTGISEAIIKKNINRQIDNNTVARWLRSKMLEWHKQFGFSVPIYNKKHEIIWPVVDSGKKADNIQTNTKAYLLEKRNNYLNLIQQKTKFLGHYDEMTQTGFLEEIIELYENRLKEE